MFYKYDNFIVSKNVVICPVCGNEMKPVDGCWLCVYCGYSPCS